MVKKVESNDLIKFSNQVIISIKLFIKSSLNLVILNIKIYIKFLICAKYKILI